MTEINNLLYCSFVVRSRQQKGGEEYMGEIVRRMDQQPKKVIPDGNLNRRMNDDTGPAQELVMSPTGMDSAVSVVHEIHARREQRKTSPDEKIPYIGGSSAAEGKLFDQALHALSVYCETEAKRPMVYTGHVTTVVDFTSSGRQALSPAMRPLPSGDSRRITK